MLFEEQKYLWLLLAALIPLIIHLINRGKRNVLDVGSLNWLAKKEAKQTKKIKFQQFTLWFIRSVIFILISFVVARPFFLKNEKIANQHLLLVKEDTPKEILATVIDTINFDKWNAKWLNWDLEDVDLKLTDTSAVKAIHPYKAFELIAHKKIKPLSVTVLGNYNQHQLKFKLPPIDFPVNWLSLPFENENKDAEIGIISKADKTEILKITQSEFLAKIVTKELGDNSLTLPISNFDIDTIVIVFDERNKSSAKILKAALRAVIEYQNMPTTVLNLTAEKVSSDLQADVLFWLGDSIINDSKTGRFQNIYFYDEQLDKNSYAKVDDSITHFNFEMESKQIPGLLNKMLFENNAINQKYNDLLAQPVNATFYTNFENKATTETSSIVSSNVNLNNYLVLIVLSLIIVERLICLLSD